jgi:hypothetical protein
MIGIFCRETQKDKKQLCGVIRKVQKITVEVFKDTLGWRMINMITAG